MAKKHWTPDAMLEAIRTFVQTQGRVPRYDDVTHGLYGLPLRATIERYWKPWQRAVREAGFDPVPSKPRQKPREVR